MASINIEALKAERAALVAANEAATGWGAAVGARHERIKGIDRALALAGTPSLTNPNPKREDEREAKATDVIGYLNVYRDDDGDLVTGSSDLCATAEEAADFAASEFADHVGVFALVPAASARPSPGDPVRAAEGSQDPLTRPPFTLSDDSQRRALAATVGPNDEVLARVISDAQMLHDILTLEPSKTTYQPLVEATRRAVAALSVSTPTGEGEELRFDRRAQAAALADLPVSVAQEAGEFYENAGAGEPIKKSEAMAVAWAEVLRPYLIGLRDHYAEQSRPVAEEPTALAHPQQGGERDGWKPIAEASHDCTLYELEVPSDGKGLRDAETSITIGSNNGDHDGEDRWTYAGWSWCQDRYIHMDTADGAPMPIRFREIRPDHLGRSASEPDPAVSPGNGHHLSYSGAPMPPDGIEGCVYCGQPFKEGDLVLDEVEGGEGHVACMGPERDGYVGADGEPLKDGEPIPTGRPWTPTSPSKSSGEEA